MSTNPYIPQNWIYSSKQFSMSSDALSENIAIYRPVRDTHSSQSPANAIKVVVDSNSSFLRPQRSYLAGTIRCFNGDGTPLTTAEISRIGAMGCFRSVSVALGGKQVDNIEDYPSLISDMNQFVSAQDRKYLRYNEGAGNPDAFKNPNGEFKFKHHLKFGILANSNGNPLPISLLPNQSMELVMTLNTPQNAFTNWPNGAYFTVSNVRMVCQMVTPSAAYLSAAWKGITSGKSLELDYVSINQISNNCSGASQNNFILPLSNARIIGLTHRFRDDNLYATNTGDKADIYGTANLKSFRYQIGAGYRLPLTEDFQVEDVPMISNLSLNDNASYQSEDVDLENFFDKQFVIRYSWQSSDEEETSALNTIGSDGNIRLITTHNLPAPSTSVSLVTTVYSHRTLLVGATVDTVG